MMPSDSSKPAEPEQPNGAGNGAIYDPRTKIPVVLELREIIALAVLYENADEDMDLYSEDGQWHGESLDYAMLKIGEAFARFIGDKEALLEGGAIRAMLDQGL